MADDPTTTAGGRDVPAEEVRAWVERTCAEQGVPVQITDPVTVRRVATLLDGKVRGQL